MNRIYKILLPLIIFSVCATSLNAQIFGGTVKDEHGRPLQGVSVVSEHGKNATASSYKGQYELSIDDGSSQVRFLLKGYESQILPAGETENVTLKRAETYDLDEKVFFGHYAQRKGDVTGSIARVTGEELRRSPTGNLSMSLAGRLPGLFTRETMSEPARTSTELRVRGASMHGNTALVVIDGFPYDYNSNQLFEYISAAEVESITVLKDASAQALYGIQGACGVIVITTKRGVKQPLKIDIYADRTYEKMSVTTPHISSGEFVQMRNEAGVNDGFGEYYFFSQKDVEGFVSGENRELYPDNNWRKISMRDVTHMNRLNINLTGGNDKATFYTNVNLLHQDGLWKVEQTKYDPNNQFLWANIRSNVDIKLAKYLSVGLNLSGNIKREKTPGGNGVSLTYGGSWNGFAQAIHYRMFSLPPYVYGPTTPLVQDPETGLITGDEVVVTETEPITPWAVINRLGYDQFTVTNIYAQFAPRLDLDFLTPGLSLSGYYGYQTNTVKGLFTNQTYEEWVRTKDFETLEFEKIRTQVNTPLQHRASASFYYNLNYKGVLNYRRKFDVHDVSAMVYSFYQNLNKEAGGSEMLPYKRVSSGVEVAYGYDDRYLLKFDLGYSGSEQYSRQNRFHTTPAVSAGWVVSNESFLRENNLLTYLKLRASWGKTASDRGVGRYVYLDNVTLGGGGLGFLRGYSVNEGQAANPFLDPEIAEKKNFGLDLSLFNNLSLSVDVFTEDINNMVSGGVSKIPAYQGIPLGNYPRSNTGIFTNKGYEIALDFRKDLLRDLTVNIGGWVAYAKNEYVFNDESERAEDYAYRIRQEGYPLGQEWGYIVDTHNGNGYFNSQQEIDESGLIYEIGTPRPGDLIYYDLNADGKINDKDKAPLGRGALPEFYYAFHGGLQYKNFDLNILFQGIADYWAIDMSNGRVEYNFEGIYTQWHKHAWTPERYAAGEEILYPALSSKKSSNHEASNFFLEDKSYLRLKNLEIGYNFNLFNGVRLYLSGQNLFTWDKLKHKDYGPEAHYSGNTGMMNIQVYRLYNVGLSVKF
jgi:TonB-linked SusC/RagA family outer membrane protein